MPHNTQTVPQNGEDNEANQESQYNPNASPPDLTKALKHQNARRVGRIELADNENKKVEYCDCCGLTINHRPLPLCGSRLDLADLGAGFPLYFEYVFFCGILLGLLFLIVGIWSLVSNQKGLQCALFSFSTEYQCKGGFIMQYSMGNKGPFDDFRINSILNLVFVVVGILVAFYYRRVQSMTADEVDRGAITTSDYTVMVSGIPSTESADQIKTFFQKKGKQGKGETVVKKVNLAYEIGTYVGLVRKKAKLTAIMAKGSPTQKDKDQLLLIESKLKVFEEAVDNNTSNKFTGITFVTFNTEKDVNEVIRKFQMGPIQKILYNSLKSLLSCFGVTLDKTYNGKIIKLGRAPDPLDVFWENLGHDWWKTMRIRLMSFISTFGLIGMSFGMILGISYWQENIKKNNASNGSLISFLAFLGSYVVVIINGLIGFFMRKLAGLEKHTTYTYYFISIANKLTYAQFINTALITLFVQLVRGETIRLWVQDSLVSKVFFLFLLNAFVPSLTYLFNPGYILRLWKRSRMISAGENSKMTQEQANLLFEGPPVDIAQRYANIQKTLLFTGFYANLVPIGIAFSFVGLFITYWTDKYVLLRRHSRPNVLGKELAEEMSDFLELFFVAFTSGNLVFEKVATGEISTFNIIACALSVAAFLLPQQILAGCIRKSEHGVFNTREYDEVRLNFVTEYDRVNPITQEDATREWIMEISTKMAESQQKDGQTPAPEVKNLSDYFKHMPPRQNQFSNLANYANNNLSFNQMHQMNGNTNFNMSYVQRPPQPMMFAPIQQTQTQGFIPMMPQNRFTAVPNQMLRFANQQVNRFAPIGVQNMFGFNQPRPPVANHFPQQQQQVNIQMTQPKPIVANHFPPQQVPMNQPVVNHFPQQQPPANRPPVVNHFPQQQPPPMMSQPIIVKPQPQPQPQQFQPNMMPMNQAPMMQAPMMQQQNIQMTQQMQPNLYGQPQFQAQPQYQPQPQPQAQFGFQQQQFGNQMNYNAPKPTNSVFGGQPGFGFRNQGF